MVDFDVGQGDEAQESELPALELLVNLGYEYKSKSELNKTRTDYRQVLLYDRLEKSIRKLNPKLDEDGIQSALGQIREDAFPRTLETVDTNEKIRAKMIGLSNSHGLEPITVTQNYGNGAEQKTVRLFDFENPDNNDFVVTNQFQLEGLKNPIFPDIVLFVNGIPLVIIECKSPIIPTPIEQAVEKNFEHYQTRGLGYERLFFYNHCLVATCGTLARHGTINSDVNYFARWGKAYPYDDRELERICNRKPREQEILLAGMFSKKHLLDMMENYVIYDVIQNKKIKKIAKHQQYRTVDKSIDRLKSSQEISDKGGVIWHTQGSGKSYTMLWFATQLVSKLDNPPILIVTDRKQLDRQIHDTFENSGYPMPIKADSAKHLSELLANPKGKTIMTTIQKFATEAPIYTDQKAIVLVDEAHRTQFKITAAAMRKAMPNSVFFAFTGTPIDKKDRNNYKVFGELVDKYGFEESKADGATLQIEYESRLPELFVEGGQTIEQIFERVFSSLDQEMKDKLKKQYVTKGKIAEAPSRIKKIAFDIVNHYTAHIEPNGYKAMLVAPSREGAVIYKQELDKLNVPSKIIMTSHLGEKGKDDKLWDEYYLSNEQREREAEKFKDQKDPTKILIVVDMLLVGYDAPIVQVLYLDQTLKEHNLLQAIARVNRPYDEAKDHGLIVDYCGVTKDLKNALEIFEEQDIQGALIPIDHELDDLRNRHKKAMSHFKGIDRNSIEQIIEHFEPVNDREELENDFKQFSKALDAVMPRKEADPYIDDFKFLSMARQAIRTYYEGVKPSTKPYAKKIQQLIDDHIRSLGIRELINPMEVTYENFLSFVDKFKSNRARTALVKAKAIQVIQTSKPNNPAYYEKLWERLQRLIEEEKARRKEDADFFAKYKEIYEQAVNEEIERKKVFGQYEAHPYEFALYGEIEESIHDRKKSIDATKAIFAKIQQEANIVGWKNKTSSEKKIMESIYEELGKIGFPDDKMHEFAQKMIEIAKHRV